MTVTENAGPAVEDVDFNRIASPDRPLRPIPPGRDFFAPRWRRSQEFLFGPWIDIDEELGPNDFTRLRDDYFWQADEHIIPVVDLFERVPYKQARAMFEQALTRGIENLDDPPPELVQFFDRVDSLPDWLDVDAAKRGMLLVSSASLMSAMSIGGWAGFETVMTGDISAATGASGRFKHDGIRRNIETIRMFALMAQPSVFDRGSVAFQTVTRVRLMHALVSRGLRRKWGEQVYLEYGEPIAATSLLGFGNGPLLVRLADHRFGRTLTAAELDDVAMYSAYTSWALGAPDNLRTKSGLELIRSLNYVFARGGDPTSWRAELLEVIVGAQSRISLELMPVISRSERAKDRAWPWMKRAQVAQLGIPLVPIFGADEVEAMVADTEFASMKIDYDAAGRWYERAARVNAVIAHARDAIPGTILLREQIHGRLMPNLTLRTIDRMEAVLKHAAPEGSMYTHHDNSPTGGLDGED